MNPLLLIRIALLSGVLLFGAVVYFQQRNGATVSMQPGQAEALVWAARVLWGVAIAGTIGVWQMRQRAATRPQVQQWSIIGYALGEMVALFGAVVWYLTGTPSWYLPGVLFLAITFLVFPARVD